MARLLLDGRTPDVDQLAALAAHNYGHYTAFIAVAGAVRGWSLHLARLRRDAAALGLDLDLEAVCAQLRTALHGCGSTPQSVRITVFAMALDMRRLAGLMPASVLVRMQDWSDPVPAPLHLRSHAGLRETPQTKHIGLCAALLARRQAQLAGADDALLLDAAGCISEGPTWNLGIFDGEQLRWPSSPALPGVTLQLLARALQCEAVMCAPALLRAADLHASDLVFACNARQPVMAVAALDGRPLSRDPQLEQQLLATYQRIEWEPV